MLDINTLIEVDSEARQYQEWERQEKNRILSLHDSQTKQAQWNRLFGTKQEPDDSYLEGGIY